MTTFDTLFLAILAFNALLVAGFAWAFYWPSVQAHRIDRHVPLKVALGARIANNAFIGTFSLALSLGIAYGLKPWLMRAENRAWSFVLLEALAVLVVYDFLYYLLHRSLHHPRVMRFVHAIHHRARFPTALESLYQHPLELLSGLSTLALALWIVGPVSPYAFLLAFFVYSTGNVLIHIGFEVPLPGFRPINYLARKHYIHHSSGRGNYASLSPLPDWIFRTLR